MSGAEDWGTFCDWINSRTSWKVNASDAVLKNSPRLFSVARSSSFILFQNLRPSDRLFPPNPKNAFLSPSWFAPPRAMIDETESAPLLRERPPLNWRIKLLYGLGAFGVCAFLLPLTRRWPWLLWREPPGWVLLSNILARSCETWACLCTSHFIISFLSHFHAFVPPHFL